MKVKNSISTAIISATVGLLNSFVPELTPTRLITALHEYDAPLDNERPKASTIATPQIIKIYNNLIKSSNYLTKSQQSNS